MSGIVHDWSPFLAVLISCVVGMASYFIRNEAKSMVSKAETNVITRLNKHHDRLIRLEGVMETLPTRQDFHALAISNTEMIGEMKAMNEKVRGMHETLTATQRSVQRVNDYLLDQKK